MGERLKKQLIELFEVEIRKEGAQLTKEGRYYVLYARGRRIKLLIYQVADDGEKTVPQGGRWSTDPNLVAELPKQGGLIYLVGSTGPFTIKERFGVTKDEFTQIEPRFSRVGDSYRVGRPDLEDKKFGKITDFLGRF